MNLYPVANAWSRRPVVSQAFDSPGHLGVDIMWLRSPADPHYSPSDPRGTKGYVALPCAMCVASQAGSVIYAKAAPNGYRVRLAAEDGAHFLYLHLADLRVSAGARVLAGAVLGLMGGDPTSADPRHTVHLHWERRLHAANGDGWGMVPSDPAAYLRECSYL